MVHEQVKGHKRTRRADKAQQTHQRIIDAATRLFLDRGYVPTTIEAIAQAADVAVETVYARFGTKTNLMVAVKDAAVTERGQIPLHQRPELAALAAEPSQRQQLAIAAALSRGMLQRISPVYALLRDAAAADGTLRDHLAPEQAADTYSALANPDLYLLLTSHHGWTPSQYQAWLADTLQRLLLPAP